jgi:hypothetical protein
VSLALPQNIGANMKDERPAFARVSVRMSFASDPGQVKVPCPGCREVLRKGGKAASLALSEQRTPGGLKTR